MTHVTTLATLSIGSVTIRAHSGLYNLNDLHQASGSEAKHQPSNFIRLDTTQALIAELCSSDVRIKAIETVRGRGKAQGTYACRELVIAYAAWISAAFQLKVIRVFLDTAAPAVQQPLPLSHVDTVSPALVNEIVTSAAEGILERLEKQCVLIHWQQVITAVKHESTAMTFADLTDLAHACLKRLQRRIDAEAYTAIDRRAANRNQTTATVSLTA